MRPLLCALMLSLWSGAVSAQATPQCEVDPDYRTRHGVGMNNRRVCDMQVRCRFGGEVLRQRALCFEVNNRCPAADYCLNHDMRDEEAGLPLPGARTGGPAAERPPRQNQATDNDAMFY